MAQQTRATVKATLETADVPTEAEFIDFVDSCFFLAEVNNKTFTSGGTDDYVLNVTATLNDPGAAGGSDIFRGIKVNVTETDTTGWNQRYLIDLLIGGTSQFAIGNDGNLYLGTTTAPTGTSGEVVVLGDNAGNPTPGTDTCTIHAAAETEIIGPNIKVYATAENGNLAPLVPYKLPRTLGAAATTFAADAPLIELTGNAGGNNVTTITGDMAYGGSRIYILFTDALVTLVHDDTHAANTIDLSSGKGANFTGSDDLIVELVHDGISWYEAAGGSTAAGSAAAYGAIEAESNAVDTAITTSSDDFSNKVQYEGFSANGLSLNTTPDHTTDDITIDLAGTYLITAQLSLKVQGTASTLSGAIFKNNGATQLGPRFTVRDNGPGIIQSASLVTIESLAVNDTIEIWVQNENNTEDIDIDDAVLTVAKIN